MTFIQIFAQQISKAVSTQDTAIICKEMISVFQQAQTFHQFHQAWLEFESYKYFQYNQNHHDETFSVFIENPELQDEESEHFGLQLYMIFGHDYKTKSANIDRIDYAQVINSSFNSDEFDLSKSFVQ